MGVAASVRRCGFAGKLRVKTTILYLNDSTACWTLWRGRRLLRVFCEPVTREMAERAAVVPKKDGIQSSCPWLSVRSPKVRLLIDPVLDRTRTIPAFDYGFLEPKGVIESSRNLLERMYVTCRSLTSDVLADDLTRYRRDQLKPFPKALLHWFPPKATWKTKLPLETSPPSWLITESGIPDFILDWMHAMSEQGLEIVDVQPVSALVALADKKLDCSVITIWAEPKRWRLLITTNGYLKKTDQWSSEIDARIALDDAVNTMKEYDCDYAIRFIGEFENIDAWRGVVPEANFLPAVGGFSEQTHICALAVSALPLECHDLPLCVLLQTVCEARVGIWPKRTPLDLGDSIRRLLLKARWKGRYQRSMIATAVAAILSGYVVLLASMHALEVIELNDRAQKEMEELESRRDSLHDEATALHSEPLSAVSAIERLSTQSGNTAVNKQEFFSELADLLDTQPAITLNAISWRPMPAPISNDEPIHTKLSHSTLVAITELVDTPAGIDEVETDEDLILISGKVQHESNQQEAFDTLFEFLTLLSASNNVAEVIPITHSLSLNHTLNLPSDAVLLNEDPSAFVIAVRLSV